uniref:Oxidative stress-responsive serine-rich protein 1 n=1 Tax=Caenorhabditis japonica TaxID=281687 RepID=A0A8R1DTZ6_CAEJA
MTKDEPPTALSLPSTSTCTPTCDSTLPTPSISLILSLDFDKLSLNPELCEGRYHQRASPGPQPPTKTTRKTESMPPVVKKVQYYRTPAHRNGRFLPYGVPFKLRRRRKSSNSIGIKPLDLEVFLKIKLKGEVEPARMCIFDKEKVLTKPCSVQAVRPPSPEAEAEDIDELSEYFTHFVRVDLKMSSLAESMYV